MHILVAIEGPVTTITLNRPEAMNALNPEMHVQLQHAFDAFAAADDQLVCVITGAGNRAFCAGSDLKAAARSGLPATYPQSGYAGLIERFDCPKPFIAAVNGVALGGGFEIALACDIVIAADVASFGLPEPLVGAVALGGGLHRLARQAPLKQAMGLILASRRATANEALRMGLVNEVVAADQLLEATARWVGDILRASPMALRTSKALVQRGLTEPDVETAMRNQPGYAEFVAWRTSDDAREGPRAFAEKRKPVWKGR
ncbi:enoyl-CoA hydratase-related protein [Sandaracinobacter sp. RS1-74]|uniref:enoyl-CoA hydratase-related protein n=1 Tax=Sandaracinobacteroides sayramensis TaxID=2913411 RepID=UPI001EDB9CD2|nr:enoyl-CoA hydratase-related protein [Sandaracinobacteroides sayramensis]MCG2840899.1 enoyl-CoA hydratase-related protein [Sandaracinobacteroides sayramensis]